MKRLPRTALALLLTLSACGDDKSDDDGDTDESVDIGPSTGAVCPTSDPPTYENFGKAFMASYCTRCHSSDLSGAARNGAPPDHNFETQGGVQAALMHIDQSAAKGPNATNTMMPLTAPKPSDAEREKLGAWIACGAE